MKAYTRPRLACYGDVATLTQGKTAIGTDAQIGGQTQPGEFCIGDTDSRDCRAISL